MLGDLVAGRYRLEAQLGVGGLGTAFRARDEVTGRDVAVKMVDVSAGPSGDFALRTELIHLRGVVHPRLVRLLDHGVHASRHDRSKRRYLVTQIVEGTPLTTFAAGRSRSVALAAFGQALEALATLHAAGVRHGDFKPDNILVSPGGEATLLDLSCAQRLGEAAWPSGTPGFVAPEVLRGAPADGRADLFGAGETLRALEAVVDRESGATLEALCDRLTAHRPEERPSSVAEVVEALGLRWTPPQALVVPPTLIGREEEKRRWIEALESLVLRRPGPRIVSLVGEEGAGKSRLFDELRMLGQERARVVEGFSASDDAVSSMLRRATSAPEIDASSLELLGRLSTADEPIIVALDDLDRLSLGQAEEWDLLLRSLDPDGVVMVLATTRAGRSDLGSHAVELPVAPLTRAEVAAWVGDRGAPCSVDRIFELTRGVPSEVRALLEHVAHARGDVDELLRRYEGASSGATGASPHPSVRDEASSLLGALADSDQRFALALVASGDALDARAAVELGADARALDALTKAGHTIVDAGGHRLRRRSARRAVLAALADVAPRAERAWATWLLSEARSVPPGSQRHAALRARAVLHLCSAGDLARARACFEEARSALSAHPDAWVPAVLALSKQRLLDPGWYLDVAATFESAGRWREALAILAQCLGARPPAADRARIRLRAAAAYLKAGSVARARGLLERAMPALRDDDAARAHDLASRLHVRSGRYADAQAVARRGLEQARDPSVVADLCDACGVALSYLDRPEETRSLLDRAATLHRSLGRTRAEARSIAYLALAEYRIGDASAALRGFERSQVLAERVGATDLAMYSAQNGASAAHQLGELDRALGAYGTALRLARALGDRIAMVGVSANLAKLYADLGLWDRAEREAASAEEAARALGASLSVGVAASVRGEASLASGDPTAALSHFQRSREALGEARRERLEVEIQVVEALVAKGSPVEARAALHRVLAPSAEVAAPDLSARVELARARVARAANRLDEAAEAIERALALARRTRQVLLQAEVLVTLAKVARERGRVEEAERASTEARVIFRRTSASLDPAIGDAFLRHPHRVDVEAPEPPRPSSRDKALETLLAINKRLGSSLDPTRVLDWTIDGALDLTGAERGLIIGSEGDSLRIVASRNIDAESGETVAFSTSIARRVVDTQTPLVTVDARHDERLRGASIHTMRLTSVAAVPIIGPGSVLGVLYLDHRRNRGHFHEGSLETLLAFADQAAIALTNARLHEELRRRTAELDALARGQSDAIEALTLRVTAQQEALEARFDYERIVGRRSAGMRAIFRVLDRVIDADVPVLIQGESGTGKELLAKAIHYNSKRRKGPLLSINCGAIPESLLESELFGHVRGAFTGAVRDSPGLFQAAKGGTVFLDEIGEMPPAMQVKLLRVLQEREVTPLGSHRSTKLDVRVIAATNRRLDAEIRAGRFREDLYYRIGVVEVTLPPLRERGDDMPELVDHLVTEAARRAGVPKPRVPATTIQALMKGSWPGNVRQLENVILKAVLLHGGRVLEPQALDILPSGAARTRTEQKRGDDDELLRALRATRWNVSEAARRLGVSRPTIYRRMRELGMTDPPPPRRVR